MTLPYSASVRVSAPPLRGTERLFVALWPDDATRERLTLVGRRLCPLGRRVPGANLHMTLVFLGQVEPTRRKRIAGAMRAACAPSLTLALDHCGYFSAGRIAWLGPSVMPLPLTVLQGRLAANHLERGFALGKRMFRAHVTRARHPARPDATSAGDALPVHWRVSSMALIGSRASRYDVLRALRIR